MKKKLMKIVLAIMMVGSMLSYSVKESTIHARITIVTTWEGLKNALEKEGDGEILVEKNTVIREEKALNQNAEDYMIQIKGKKKLTIDGVVSFYNSVDSKRGLMNIGSNSELSLHGDGSLLYSLQYIESGLAYVIEEGNLIYLYGGSLKVYDNLKIKVNGTTKRRDTLYVQAPIAGNDGTVYLYGGRLSGNSIEASGITYYLDGGLFDCGRQNNIDFILKNGDVYLERMTFQNGIKVEGGTLHVNDDVMWIGQDGVIEYEVPQYTPGIVHRWNLQSQNPEMSEGDEIHLGAFECGTNKTISFAPYPLSIIPAGWDIQQDCWILVSKVGGRVDQYQQTSFNIKDLAAGEYYLYQYCNIEYNGAPRTETKKTYHFSMEAYQIEQVDTEVAYTLNEAIVDATSNTKGISVVDTKWYKKVDNQWVAMNDDDVVSESSTYRVQISINTSSQYALQTNTKIYINQRLATKISDQDYYVDFSPKKLQTGIDLYDIMRPVPNLKADFNCHIESANVDSVNIKWMELDSFGDIVKTLSTSDTFKKNTQYLLKIDVKARSGYEFLLHYADINREEASYEFSDDTHTNVILSMIYDTSKCIDSIEISNIQYPLGGYQPTQVAYISDDRYEIVDQGDDTYIDWYYLPVGGSVYLPLQGSAKYDTSHQALIELEAKEGYYFAIDEQGNSVVSGSIAQGDIAFSYSNDSLLDDSCCTKMVFARTFEKASTLDSIFINGIEVKNGQYYGDYHLEATNTPLEDEYAYYHDGILELKNFEQYSSNGYSLLYACHDLIIQAEGYNKLHSNDAGIYALSDLTMQGEGTLYVYGSYGIFAWGDVTLNGASTYLLGSVYNGINIMNLKDESLKIKSGQHYVYGPQTGIDSDDQLPIYYEGGTLITNGQSAVGWTDIVSNVGNVIVIENEEAQVWNQNTPLSDYPSVAFVTLQAYAYPMNYKTIQVKWPDYGASTYHVYRRTSADKPYTLMESSSKTEYVDTVMTGKTYDYKIVMEIESESFGGMLETVPITCKTMLEGTPELNITKVGNTKFTLSWNKIDGATRYIIYRKREGGSYKKVLTLGKDDFSYTTASMAAGTYYYMLRAGRYDSVDRVMTNKSNEVIGKSVFSKPVITLTAGSKQIKVSWNAVEGIKYYQVYRATSKSGKYTKLKTTTATSYTNKSLTSGKSYYYKVRGYKEYEGEKIYSNFSEIKTTKAK